MTRLLDSFFTLAFTVVARCNIGLCFFWTAVVFLLFFGMCDRARARARARNWFNKATKVKISTKLAALVFLWEIVDSILSKVPCRRASGLGRVLRIK